jgi:PKD repeat protein
LLEDKSTNDPTEWSWDFGLGASPSTSVSKMPGKITYNLTWDQFPYHTKTEKVRGEPVVYRIYEPKEIEIKLTVKNSAGSSNVCKKTLKIYHQPEKELD